MVFQHTFVEICCTGKTCDKSACKAIALQKLLVSCTQTVHVQVWNTNHDFERKWNVALVEVVWALIKGLMWLDMSLLSLDNMFTGWLKQASFLLLIDRLFKFGVKHTVVNYAALWVGWYTLDFEEFLWLEHSTIAHSHYIQKQSDFFEACCTLVTANNE